MSESTVRTAIYNVVNGVTDAGKVYDRIRFSTEWSHDDFLGMFKVNIGGIDQIRGWMVEYKGFVNEILFGCENIRRHTFVVNGYNRFNDTRSSEKEFSTLAVAIADALDADTTVHTHSDTVLAQLTTLEPRMFGRVLCHFAEITQVVTEEV